MSYGRAPAPPEATEQTWLFAWARMAEGVHPELALLHHIPNGGSRNKAEAARLRAQGVKRGIPDICLPCPRGEWHGLYIELKRTRGGRVSEDQRDVIAALRREGYRVEVCMGYEEARKTIEDYLGGKA